MIKKLENAKNELRNVVQTCRFSDDIHLRQNIDSLLTEKTGVEVHKMTRRSRELHKATKILRTSLLSNKTPRNLCNVLSNIITDPKATQTCIGQQFHMIHYLRLFNS